MKLEGLSAALGIGIVRWTNFSTRRDASETHLLLLSSTQVRIPPGTIDNLRSLGAEHDHDCVREISKVWEGSLLRPSSLSTSILSDVPVGSGPQASVPSLKTLRNWSSDGSMTKERKGLDVGGIDRTIRERYTTV